MIIGGHSVFQTLSKYQFRGQMDYPPNEDNVSVLQKSYKYKTARILISQEIVEFLNV